MFLKLSSQVEGQLREAYARKHADGILNQSLLADKIGVDRSAINRRLAGKVNMTEETIADMVWGLDHDIEVRIFDPAERRSNQKVVTLGLPTVATPNPLLAIAGVANVPTANTHATSTAAAPTFPKMTVMS
jgi:hypothetical protein